MKMLNQKEAERYLVLRKEAAPKIALATFLCIISPVCLIVLAGISDSYPSGLTENMACGIGLCVLLGMVAAAVMLFMKSAAASQEFSFLENEPFEADENAIEMVRARKAAYRTTYAGLNIRGTVLCILSVMPLAAAMCVEESVSVLCSELVYILAVALLLVLVACGCYAFVCGGVYQSAIEKLLEEGDYTRSRKSKSHFKGAVSTIYWLVVTAVYLFYTFGPYGNGHPEYSWFIWAVAGVLFGALMVLINILSPKDK